jgi:uncharacterized protein (DUF1778 family)
MDTEPTRSKRRYTEAIHLRLSTDQRTLIDQAAEARGQSRNQFILETACQEAQSVLLDQTHFNLVEDAFLRFTELLDALPKPNPGLARLLETKAPWEEQAATSPAAPAPGRSGGLRGR